MRVSALGPAVIGGLLVSLLLPACDDDTITGVRNTRFSAEEPFELEFERAARTEFRLVGINGSVEIAGVVDGTAISISGVRRVESESVADATEHLEQLVVDVVPSENVITVRTEQPKQSEGRNYIVNYVVSIPVDLQIDVSNINGDVDVESIDAAADVVTINGRIAVSGMSQDTDLLVTNGGVYASLTPEAGRIVGIEVINGFIDLEIPSSTSSEFSAEVANGSIRILGLSFTNSTQTTGSVTGTLGVGEGAISLSVINGTISVEGV